MFDFLKKKSLEAPKSPKNGVPKQEFVPIQQSKVEDEVASFEIPDFTEEDLNFDLGLGEFMPNSNEPKLPIPQGLSIDVPEDKIKPLPPLISASQLNESNSMQKNMNQVESIETKAFAEDPIKEIIPPQKLDVNQTKFQWLSEDVQTELPSDDLPKFNVQGGLSFSDLNLIYSKNEIDKNINKKTEHKSTKQKKVENTVIKSSDGLFIPKKEHNKIIILSDDTCKKTTSAESIKANFISLSEQQDININELEKTMKSIRDSVLLVDSKLFAEGDTK
ncbi:MAG: hypothetical protein WC758_05745 [Candidatus Woesearchaeota archaeon]|jgi:hypothetical protein